jgi:uncharacterized protein
MSTSPPPPGDHPDTSDFDETVEHRAPLPPPPSPPPSGGEHSGEWSSQAGHGQQQSQSWGSHGGPYRPAMSPSDERTWAMLAHISGLSFLFGLPVIGPLVVWLIKREQSAFVDTEGKEALNFSLSVLLYLVVGSILGGLLTAITLGLGIIPVALVALIGAAAWLVLTILAAVSASDGRPYRYPLNIRFIK